MLNIIALLHCYFSFAQAGLLHFFAWFLLCFGSFRLLARSQIVDWGRGTGSWQYDLNWPDNGVLVYLIFLKILITVSCLSCMAAKVVIALKKFWTRIVSSANEFPSQLATVTKLGMSISEIQRRNFGDETLRPQDTSAPRHFGIGAEVSSDTSAPVPKCLETLRHRFL